MSFHNGSNDDSNSMLATCSQSEAVICSSYKGIANIDNTDDDSKLDDVNVNDSPKAINVGTHLIDTNNHTNSGNAAISAARRLLQESFARSRLLKQESVLPRFALEELERGNVLGRGGFGTVWEIRAVTLSELDSTVPEEEDSFQKKRRHLFSKFSFKPKRPSFLMKADSAGLKVRHTQSFDALGEFEYNQQSTESHCYRNHHQIKSLRRVKSEDALSDLTKTVGAVRPAIPTRRRRSCHEQDRNHSHLQSELQNLNESTDWRQKSIHTGKSDDPSKESERSLTFSFVSWRDSLNGVMEHHFDAVAANENLDSKQSSNVRNCLDDTVSMDRINEENNCNDASNGNVDIVDTQTQKDHGDNHPRLVPQHLAHDSHNFNQCSPSSTLDVPIENGTSHSSTDITSYDISSLHSTKNSSIPQEHIVLISESNNGDRPSCAKEEDQSSSFHSKISLPPPNRQFIATHALTTDGKTRYAIKAISPEIIQQQGTANSQLFLQAAMDMVKETYYLSVLQHPHIITLRGVGMDDMFSSRYFLLFDRLYDTLEDRIDGSWKRQKEYLENSIFIWNRTKKQRLLWEERVGVLRDLAGALSYLHGLGVIYRDLKPENIGFDSQGIAKLFDFGLAREVFPEKEQDMESDGSWSNMTTYKNLTAQTGSFRYMSPEVGKGYPYNFSADSYSFTILLWEVMSLEQPFASYTQQEIISMVMTWGERPKLREEWSDRLKEALKNGWDSNLKKRPSMREFQVMLELELQDV